MFDLPDCETLLERFSGQFPSESDLFGTDTEICSWNRMAVHYAPFNHQPRPAKLILLGITPGKQQAEMAWRRATQAYKQGSSLDESIAFAKSKARFGGNMRPHLISMMNQIGIPEMMDIPNSSLIFDGDLETVYSGSVVRFPALKNRGNYTGSSPKLRREPTLIKMFQEWTKSALLDMPKALIVPMGIRVQELLLDEGFEDRTLIGFPHPSGANASRKKVFQNNLESMREIVREWVD